MSCSSFFLFFNIKGKKDILAQTNVNSEAKLWFFSLVAMEHKWM